ncbi:methionine ABC transporter ATP-binding protein [Marinitenerispora sediminis]|uniref:Methionine ABC transporter ATP-binding protein n=1 Tax=Marinitenerispora sediminis TaxID=1931232 RepID=A0A368T100_9ACTN|nr:ATP-binding cassette domain-containing protein [Marinitenerispora sediminis]RCV50236.1 methionine ABC transporter ATP-binding protein [Marinitenerispora sediminis]RCV53507.1 methionine ABC transporter ATP-binding protein [Marinitenerispora sediminis]RCV54575.1 methionine ABC transporter ATP-binding protein [Marinitenerispora sediminis]
MGLRKVYRLKGREVLALDGVDLHVRQGEIFGVVGQSGAGKSTLLRCVNLLERPTEGRVSVDGAELTALGGARLRAARRGIGMVHQHFALLSSRTVAGNVAFPLEIAGVPRAERRARVGELLDLVGLADKARAHPAQLSGGQKQRVGIARALASRPKVLLSDEATSALDPQTTESILDLLRRLNRELGLTILLITHEMDVIKRICDSAAIMADGAFLESGRVLDLLAAPGSRLARSLFPLPATDAPDVVTLTYTGKPDEPLMSELTRRFDVDINILGGAVEQVSDQSVGRLNVQIQGERREAALTYLHGKGLLVEVAG